MEEPVQKLVASKAIKKPNTVVQNSRSPNRISPIVISDDDDDTTQQQPPPRKRRRTPIQTAIKCPPTSSSSEHASTTTEDSSDESSSSSSDNESIQSSQHHKQQHRQRSKTTTPTAIPALQDLRSEMSLKMVHEERPLWVTPQGMIYAERFCPTFSIAYDLLAAVAEPMVRSEFMQEWKLTKTSLHTASSIEMTPEGIIRELDKFCKNELCLQVKNFIKEHTESYGKVKLVLRAGSLFVESTRKDLLFRLLANPTVAQCRIPMTTTTTTTTTNPPLKTMSQLPEEIASDMITAKELPPSTNQTEKKNDHENTFTQPWCFRVDPSKTEALRRCALELKLPLMDEYDYRNDKATRDLKIQLLTPTKIRGYQEKCLNKMFGNGRAKSGLFVLPCGAGKTLTGIVAICTLRKSCLIICTNTVSVNQWKRQLELFSDVLANEGKEHVVVRLTSKYKDPFPGDNKTPCIVLTTYTMITSTKGEASRKSGQALRQTFDRDWGLLILDEVHVAPANVFRRIVSRVRAHCKLGLTATLVREDDLIEDLSFLIGPKLYEADWMDLTEQGFLARVSCQEVRVPMNSLFMSQYLQNVESDKSVHMTQLLMALNPVKIRACEFLMHHHETLGDKILIFCDSVVAVEQYALMLKRPYLHGKTPEKRRIELLSQFQHSTCANTLLISKVGDVALDMPEASVIIQVSSHGGSRRQEAQRLGRILRPKPNSSTFRGGGGGEFNAHFYTLIVPDTREAHYAHRRQRYLVDQGYAYTVMMNVEAMAKAAGYVAKCVSTIEDQRALLVKLLLIDEDSKNAKKMMKTPPPTVSGTKRARVNHDDDVVDEEELEFQRATTTTTTAEMTVEKEMIAATRVEIAQVPVAIVVERSALTLDEEDTYRG